MAYICFFKQAISKILEPDKFIFIYAFYVAEPDGNYLFIEENRQRNNILEPLKYWINREIEN